MSDINAPSLRALLLYFLRLGSLGFGGPIALAGYMQRDLVEQRGWLSEEEYRKGLALAQLAPGPLAAQLAIYIGWAHSGIPGATLAGIAFVIPSFFIVLVLSALYVRYDGLVWMQAAFYGIGAAVIAIIVRSACKLLKITVGKDRLLIVIFAVNAISTAVLEREVITLILVSGVAVLLFRTVSALPATTAAVVVPLGAATTWSATTAASASLFWFFAKAGAFVFGSGLAIVPFLYGGVVTQHRWLTEQQFLDAVAVAMITPGPVVITVAFIGYLVEGTTGAVVAALGVFLPCYLFVILPAPYYSKFADNVRVKAFVDGVSAAACGAIGGAAIVLAQRAIVDLTTILIALAVLAVITFVKRLPEPAVIAAAGLIAIVIKS